LGLVSVAHDGELNREVALKEIQGKYADDKGSPANSGTLVCGLDNFKWDSERRFPQRIITIVKTETLIPPPDNGL
jgi:hypothetical protein